jgi:hypothetical protein
MILKTTRLQSSGNRHLRHSKTSKLSPILPNQEAANNGVYKLWVLVKVLGAAREAGSTFEETEVILALNVVFFFREMTLSAL